MLFCIFQDEEQLIGDSKAIEKLQQSNGHIAKNVESPRRDEHKTYCDILRQTPNLDSHESWSRRASVVKVTNYIQTTDRWFHITLWP